jgi:hypothetical protein
MDSKTSATDSKKSSNFPIKKPKTGHWDGMMSDEIPSKTLTVIISLAHVIKDLWTAVNSVF